MVAGKEKGLLMVYTGEGKGKTTAALGQALRAAGHGYRVLVINFMKGRDYGELKAAHYLPQFEMLKAGRDGFVDRDNPDEEDLRLAAEGMARAKEALSSGQYDLVILDELNVAVHYNLVPLEDLLELINNKRPGVNVIITGRHAHEKIIEMADMVSEVKEVKHHFTAGIGARKGIEY